MAPSDVEKRSSFKGEGQKKTQQARRGATAWLGLVFTIAAHQGEEKTALRGLGESYGKMRVCQLMSEDKGGG